jgi:general secretion pathway protein I
MQEQLPGGCDRGFADGTEARAARQGWRDRGFTLLEVLIALAVLTVALAAVMRSLAQSIDTSAALRDRTLALWLAQNRLADRRLSSQWPSIDTTDGEAEYAGLTFRYREQVSATAMPELRRVDIEIRAKDRDETLTKLSDFLREPGK